MPNEKEAAPARAVQNTQLTSNQVQNDSSVVSTTQELSSREPEIPDATDSGSYRAKVISLPSIRLNRYVHVLIELTFDGEPVAHLREQFDIRAPRKLMRFLQAIGEPCSDTEPFKVVPRRWCEKTFEVGVVQKQWKEASGATKEKNIIVEFLPCA
jgi:hypothetical protein